MNFPTSRIVNRYLLLSIHSGSTRHYYHHCIINSINSSHTNTITNNKFSCTQTELIDKVINNFSIIKSRSYSIRTSPISSSSTTTTTTTTIDMSNLTEDEWRVKLSPAQFRVLREKGTERAYTGEYDKHFDDGVYCCAGCDKPLYKSAAKFKSECGWPAFFEEITPGALTRIEDKSHGMTRIEICCANCGGHLGHVFKGEGYKTPTDERHCVNSISLKFKSK